MGLAVSLILIAVGAVLTWAIHPAHEGSVDPQTVGVILMVVGLAAFVIDLLLFAPWGPGYMRRTTVVDGRARGYGYPRRAAAPVAPAAPARRTVVEEEVVDPPAGPPPGY